MHNGHPATAAFLPLTLAVIHCGSPDLAGGVRLADRAWAAEQAAALGWRALLGGRPCAEHGVTDRLRLLSEAAGQGPGGQWWFERGAGQRARVAAFERWVGEALREGDGGEYAEACAGYDAALAHGMARATERHRSGTMGACSPPATIPVPPAVPALPPSPVPVAIPTARTSSAMSRPVTS
jgi:hypothetical protein